MQRIILLCTLLVVICTETWAHVEATDSMALCTEETQDDEVQLVTEDTSAVNDTIADDSLALAPRQRRVTTQIVDGVEWAMVGTAEEFVEAFKARANIKLTADIDMKDVIIFKNPLYEFDYKGHEINGTKDDENAAVPYYSLKNIDRSFAYRLWGLNMSHVVISEATMSLVYKATYNCKLDEIIFEKCMMKDGDHLIDALVSSEDYNSEFSNILFIACGVATKGALAGLITGDKQGGSVKNCIALVKNTVYAYDGKAGTFIGRAINVTFENCTSYGTVSGYDDMIGGIVGEAIKGSTLTDCNFYGLVRHIDHSGDMAGWVEQLICYTTDNSVLAGLYKDGMAAVTGLFLYKTINAEIALSAVLTGSCESFTAGMNLIKDTGLPQKVLAGIGTLAAEKFVGYASEILLCCTLLEYAYFAYSIYSLGKDIYTWIDLENPPDEAGGIAGHAESATFSRCSNYGMVYSLDAYSGGILGYGTDGTIIKNCLNQGAVHGDEQTGGIAGYMDSGKIITCLNLGNVGCDDEDTAGYILGDNQGCEHVFNCYTAAESTIEDYTTTDLADETKDDKVNYLTANQKDIVSGWLSYVMNSHSNLEGEGSPWRQTVGTDHWPTLNHLNDEVTDSTINRGLSTVIKVYNMDMLASALVNTYTDIEIVRDIDFSDSYYFNLTSEYMPFRGSIEGNGHTLKNLSFAQTGKTFSFAGLESLFVSIPNIGFLGVAQHATFRNFTLSNFKLVNKTNVKYEGLFVGGSDCCTYENIHITGQSSITDDGGNREAKIIGGLVGNSNYDTFINCSIDQSCSLYTWGDTEYDAHLGGLVGDACNSTFTYCSNGATVTADDNLVGGIVGMATGSTKVSRCYNYGHLKGKAYVGGIVGQLCGCTVEYCSESGTVQGIGETFMTNMKPVYSYPTTARLIAGWAEGGFNINHCLSFGLADDVGHDCGLPLYGLNGKGMKGKAYNNYYYNRSIEGDGGHKETYNNLSEIDCTTADITSGKLTYTLNEKGWKFYQDIDNNVFPSNYPVPIPSAGTISVDYLCDGTKSYSSKYSNNASGTHTPDADKFGLCSVCGTILTAPTTVSIDNETDMMELSRATNKGQNYKGTHFDLTTDLDMDGLSYAPIGRLKNAFTGEFDGHGHRVKNLYIVSSDCAGIFGRLGDGAVIKNLIMDVSSSVQSTYEYGAAGIAGGVGSSAGEACSVTIMNCGNEASIFGKQNAAGILGGVFNNDNSSVIIRNCYNMGNITGREGSAAICGNVRKNFTVALCWNTGTVSGYEEGMYFLRFPLDYLEAFIHQNYTSGGDMSFSRNYSSTGEQYSVESFANDELASGKLCWKLNQSRVLPFFNQSFTQKDTWFQLIGTDKHPVFMETDGNKVYQNQSCDYSYTWYANHTATDAEKHSYNDDGICLRVSGEIHGAQPDYDDANNVWNISKPGHLYWIAEKVCNNISGDPCNCNLMNDIVINKNVIVDNELNSDADTVAAFLPWTPIGDGIAYTGTFNGNGHTISGIYLNGEWTDYAGLFCTLTYGANVSNLGVIDSYFCTNTGIGMGALAGSVTYDETSPSITNCYTTGIVSGTKDIGGLIGVVKGNSRPNIRNCYSLCKVNGTNSEKLSTVGALIGNTSYLPYIRSVVNNCYYVSSNTNGENECGTDKSSRAFRLGEVCQLLNKGQKTNFWAQDLETMTAPGFGTTDVTYERSVSYRWGSLILPFDVRSNGEVQYYTIKDLDSDYNLHLTAVDKVEANTPCFFRVAEGTEKYSVVAPTNGCVTPSEDYTMVAVNGILFGGLYLKEDIGGENVYYLAHDQLWQAGRTMGINLYPYRAGLLVTNSSAKSISIVSPEDETTAIGEITDDGVNLYDGPVYNIAGQQFNTVQKGQINIVNGKKILVR